jgi:hypothetical protein
LKYWKLEHKWLFNYRVENFRFIVVSSTDPYKPLVYKCTEEDLYAGRYGGKLKYNDEYQKGFDQLIDDMQWHIETNNYSYPREIYELDGEVPLSIFN